MGEQTQSHSLGRPVDRACAARWLGESTGCDTMGALAEIWRTGFLPFNPYNPLSISVCHNYVILITHVHTVPQERLLLCYWANGSFSNLSPPWCLFLLLPPIFSASKWTCTAHRILHLPFLWSVALFCLYLDCHSSFSTQIEFYLHWEYFHDYPPALPMMLTYMPFLMFLTHYGTHHTAL